LTLGRFHYLATVAIIAAGLAGHANAMFILDANAGSDGAKLLLTKAKDAGGRRGGGAFAT
jgi:hypothetical protein